MYDVPCRTKDTNWHHLKLAVSLLMFSGTTNTSSTLIYIFYVEVQFLLQSGDTRNKLASLPQALVTGNQHAPDAYLLPCSDLVRSARSTVYEY